MRFLFALLIACGLMASLGACAIVDLTAHAVKEVEKSRKGDGVSPASAPSRSASSPSSEAEEPPPPQSAPAPRRSSVTAEELPPQ
jgi:hypothetical protein